MLFVSNETLCQSDQLTSSPDILPVLVLEAPTLGNPPVPEKKQYDWSPDYTLLQLFCPALLADSSTADLIQLIQWQWNQVYLHSSCFIQ